MTASGLTLFAYLISGVCFIMALRGLSSPETARRGNVLGMVGMAIAVLTTLTLPIVASYGWIALAVLAGGVAGAVVARKIVMTALPQLVAAFNSLVGLAAVLVAFSAFYAPESYGIGAPGSIRAASLIEMSIGSVIGAVTFTGSVVAFLKLQGLIRARAVVFPLQHKLNALLGVGLIFLVVLFILTESHGLFVGLTLLSFVLGVLLIIPIGGADMPVVISMLNSYSGWAAAGIGFTLHNALLIITGALVGASGAILSYIMCKAMNRPFLSVVLGGFGESGDGPSASDPDKVARPGSPEDAAFMMKNASRVILVPGYGMAVARAQHALREMADILKKKDVEVKYAVHPVAGRMPGHMNVLLAEANVPYDEVFEMEDINSEFATTDVVYVVGANDVTNPRAKTDPKSSIYGMPILDVGRAGTVLYVKRSLSPGYSGEENPQFYADNTMMLFGDAKKMTEEVVQNME